MNSRAEEGQTAPGPDDLASPIRVLIAEDHAVVREGTWRIIDADPAIEAVGEASDGLEAVRLAAELQPDVLLLDLRMPRLGGIDAIPEVRRVSPGTRVLILSAYDDDDYVFAALEAGAAGYLLKTVHGSELIEAIHAVSRGELIFQPSLVTKLVRARSPLYDHAGGPSEPLSERELEILRLAAKAWRNKEIAQELGLSTRTVEGHLRHIYAKLGVSSRMEALLFGASRRWFAIE